MKYLIYVILSFVLLSTFAYAEQSAISDYDEIYYNLAVPDIVFENDVDPYEAEDNAKFGISPYPLMRISSTLVFKESKIQPNYYLITPREVNDNYYLLFKQGGKVRYIIPVYESKTILPLTTYPKPPEKKKQWWDYPLTPLKWGLGIVMGKDDPPPKTPDTLVKAFDLDNRYYEIDLYYNDKVYKTIYKKE